METLGIWIAVISGLSALVVSLVNYWKEKPIVSAQAKITNQSFYKTEYEGVSEEYEQLKHDHEKLQSDYDKLKVDYDKLKKDYDKLKSDHDRLKMDHDDLAKRVLAVEQKI